MVQKLDTAFAFPQQALALRAQRQQLLASNIANADTPNYKARDIDFAAALRNATSAAAGTAVAAPVLERTDRAHLAGAAGAGNDAKSGYRVPTQPSIDGNTVEMDYERAQFADNALHYEADLTVLNGQIHAMLAAIQG